MSNEVINNNDRNYLKGLSLKEVDSRRISGQTNKTKITTGKSYGRIIADNLLTFFNILLFVIAGFMIWAEYYTGLFFLAVLIPNIGVGLYEDIKAKKLLSKLNIMTQPTALAIREGYKVEIKSNDVVFGDILVMTSGSQVAADSIVKHGTIAVNESLLTGESTSITKKVGDKILAGSYVVSGTAHVEVVAVGDNNYVQSIAKAANKFKRSKSQILTSLKRMFAVIGVLVITIAAFTIIVYSVQGSLKTTSDIKESIGFISGSMVSMIPSGLYLLTSVALATAVVSLAKKKAQVQDFYSVEMLARVDCLCVDKTGTITDGSMTFKGFTSLGVYDNESIKQIMSNLLIATNDNNFTAQALRKTFNYDLTKSIVKAMPFNSDYKCSGATFSGNKTYVLGAPEFLNISNKQQTLNKCNEHTSKGLRTLVLAESNCLIGEHFNSEMTPIAILVLQDHIKDDAYETFKWFKENNVQIKVISGDNAITTSNIAKEAGIDNADNYISLEGMSIEEAKKIATKYTVFGRVTPEQKEAIIVALKEAKHTVAMTGDGVNDILALKRADCSIAMANGSDAARNVSHLVLLDSNFGRLPDVVAEGRRVINNLQRTCSVFLTKTIFAVVLSLAFLFASIGLQNPDVRYEFLTNNMYLWEIFGIGLPAFFLALQKNKEQIKGKFIKNILRKAIPGAVMIIISVALVYTLFALQEGCGFATGIASDASSSYKSEIARSMSVIIYSLLSLVVLFKVCQPFDTYRKLVFAGATLFVVGILGGCGAYSLLSGKENILLINFDVLNPVNYLEILVIAVALATIYLTYLYIVEVCKGEHINED